jgi:hypothetical protein
LLTSSSGFDDLPSVEDVRRGVRRVDVFEPLTDAGGDFPHSSKEGMAVNLVVGIALVEIYPYPVVIIT